MATAQSKPRSSSITAGPGLWIPPGQNIEIQGLTIPGGMLYVGEHLPSVTRPTPEPALISRKLAVDFDPSPLGVYGWAYAPSYQQMSAKNRGLYLRWLAGGRGPGAQQSFLMLFFYGIERRVFHDLRTFPEFSDELPILMAEVERLQSVYAYDWQFAPAASLFLASARRLHGLPSPDEIDPPLIKSSWEIPMDVRLAIGSYVANQQPVPAKWALSWWRTHPDTRIRTPAQRCASEFNDLFQIFYKQVFGEGILVRRNKKRMQLVYRPQNPGFNSPIQIQIGDMPDIRGIRAPLEQFDRIAYSVEAALTPYSRFLGSNPNSTGSELRALALLPPELLQTRKTTAFIGLEQFLTGALRDRDWNEIAVPQLLTYWQPIDSSPSKRDALPLARLLGGLGYGIEPDPRHSSDAFVLHEKAILFRADWIEGQSAFNLEAIKLYIQLGVTLGNLDNTISPEQERLILAVPDSLAHASESDRQRARAYYRLCKIRSPKTVNVKSKLHLFLESEREDLARFLVRVAAADGPVSATEIKFLTKTYSQLGLDSDKVHSEVHAVVTNAAEPVKVAPATNGGRYKIPKAKPASAVMLDGERVKAAQRSARSVEDLLSTVFSPDSDLSVPALPAPESNVIGGSTNGLLDEVHAALLETISRRELWDRRELERAAATFGLMLGGAIEVLNEASFTLIDEPLLEGVDPIEVNVDAMKAMRANG